MGNFKAIIILFIALVAIFSFQNCGNISVSSMKSESLNVVVCPHPTGDFLSAPEIPIKLFRDANICSNLGESCQSAYFRCDNGTWFADERNPGENVEFFTYRTCLSQFCEPEIPPPDCPTSMPPFECPTQWGPWSNATGQCGTRQRTCTRVLPATCTAEPTETIETEELTCPVPPPPPACPDPLPAFQCGAWGEWSKPSGLCGTRTRTCTRSLPPGCNQPTSETQTDTLNCETAPAGTGSFDNRCYVYSQYVPQCQPNSAINLESTLNGAWVYVALPSSTVLSIPIDTNMSYSGITGYGQFSFSGSQSSCSASIIELSITNRNGVIIGTRKDGSYGEIAGSLITSDADYSRIFPNNANDQADYQHCYTRQIAPTGMGGGVYISYAVPSRPDDLQKRAACVIDPAQGPWYLNVRYSYPIPRLMQDLGLSSFSIPVPPYCGWGLR